MLYLILIIIILLLLSVNSIETVINSPQIKFNKYKELDLIDKRPIIMSQNWNKSYKDLVTGKDSNDYQRIPYSNPNLKPFYGIKSNFIKKKKFNNFIKKLINKVDIKKYGEFIIIDTAERSTNNLIKNTFEKMNYHTWKSTWNLYDTVNKTFKGPRKSKLNILNKLVKYFEKKNKVFKVDKYYVKSIKQNIKNNVFIYNIILALYKQNQNVSFVVYVNFVVDKDNIYINKIEDIGFYTTDKTNLVPGFNFHERDYFYIENKDPKFYKNLKESSKYLYNRNMLLHNNTMKDQYSCINENPNYPIGQPIFYMNKTTCSEKTNMFGNKKPYGKWIKNKK